MLINYFLRRLKLATFVEKKKFPVFILEKTTKDNLLSTDLLIEKNSQILKLFFCNNFAAPLMNQQERYGLKRVS